MSPDIAYLHLAKGLAKVQCDQNQKCAVGCAGSRGDLADDQGGQNSGQGSAVGRTTRNRENGDRDGNGESFGGNKKKWKLPLP